MHMAEQRHAGHRAKQHTHQYRNEREQNPPAPKDQQQQGQNAQRGAATDPRHLAGGLLLTAGGVE
ncbi:hypothetical protein D3C75_1344080 [compost metagenome]